MSSKTVGIVKAMGTYVTVLEDEAIRDSADVASFDSTTNTIRIQPGLDNTQFELALRHELIHLHLFQAGMILTDEQEEQLCQVLSHAQYALDQDNDHLRYIERRER